MVKVALEGFPDAVEFNSIVISFSISSAMQLYLFEPAKDEDAAKRLNRVPRVFTPIVFGE
jgi:hypothetical protein